MLGPRAPVHKVREVGPSGYMDPAVLDEDRTAAARADETNRQAMPWCNIRSRMDTRTKWVIGILLFLALVLLVIGGIMAIASPPDACC